VVFALRDETFTYFEIVLERPFGLQILPANVSNRAELNVVLTPFMTGDVESFPKATENAPWWK
jgi:hypothetical protein